MKRFFIDNIYFVDGTEFYCYGQDDDSLLRIVSSFTVGRVYKLKTVTFNEKSRMMIESDFDDRYITDANVFNTLLVYMLPLCLLTPKERFLFNLSGILPERFDEYVK